MNQLSKSKDLMKDYQDRELQNSLKDSNRIFALSFILAILIFVLIMMLILFTQRIELESSCNVSNLNYDSMSNQMINMSHYDTPLNKQKIAFQSANPTLNLNNSAIQCNFKGKIPQYTLFAIMR